MFTFLAGAAGNVVVGWILRRTVEVGGWMTTLISAILLLPPDQRDVIIALLSGQGGAVSAAAYFGLVAYLWSQFLSFRATVRPQVVADGHKVGLTEEEARNAVERATGRRPTGPVTRR